MKSECANNAETTHVTEHSHAAFSFKRSAGAEPDTLHGRATTTQFGASCSIFTRGRKVTWLLFLLPFALPLATRLPFPFPFPPWAALPLLSLDIFSFRKLNSIGSIVCAI